MATEPKLQTRMRQRILHVVRDYPGLHLREIARQLDTSVALIEYHVGYLLRNELVRVQADDRYQRLFPAATGGLDAEHRDWLAVLRQPHPLNIVLLLLDMAGPVRHGEIAESLGMGKSKATFHLQKLDRAGLVVRTADGFQLVDRAATAELLMRHPPTSDLRDRFTDLWLAFYRS